MDQLPHKIRLSDNREFGPAPMEVIVQWAREGRVPHDALLVNSGTGEVKSVLAEPMLKAILQAPLTVSSGVSMPEESGLSTMIPYKNPHALWGYYIGIASWIPILGLICGPTALVLGIKGVRNRSRDPRIKGMAHAWIAIVMGSIGTLMSLGCAASIIAAVIDKRY